MAQTIYLYRIRYTIYYFKQFFIDLQSINNNYQYRFINQLLNIENIKN